MTQREIVKSIVSNGSPKSIKEIAEESGILEPNIRRILGEGAKEGTFERVDKGVYILKKDGKDVCYIYPGDAVETLPKLADKGFRADMVFLDIPYKTPAVIGGNRGIKYDHISPEEFGTLLDAVKTMVRTENTPIFYMYSKARSGIAAMQKYTDNVLETGFKPVASGEYTKLQKDGLTRVRNMRGEIIEPEGLIMLTLSGKFDKDIPNLNFTLKRPRGYQTEKPKAMLKALIEAGTNEGDIVMDPFTGSGVCIAEAVKLNRIAVGIEKSMETVKNFIIPRVQSAISGLPVKISEQGFDVAKVHEQLTLSI